MVAKGVEVIYRNAKSQAKLIDDVLDVSRVITGKLKLDVRPVDLGSVVSHALDVVRPSAAARGVALRGRRTCAAW